MNTDEVQRSPAREENCLESRMLGNLHVRFGVGAGVKFPGLHHVRLKYPGPFP
jgi:hypothetical protein